MTVRTLVTWAEAHDGYDQAGEGTIDAKTLGFFARLKVFGLALLAIGGSAALSPMRSVASRC
jgi:hypothetical protein